MNARVVEIFHSPQGEGIYLGEPMTFVRFCGCNLDCDYCDTKYARDESQAAELSCEQAIKRISSLAQNGEFVSLTGGEPLLQADFIIELGEKLKASGYKVYLETNGLLPAELEKILHLIDVVAMDIKPPSACGKPLWDTHREFLKAAKNNAFVKQVVAANTTIEEIETTAQLVAGTGSGIHFVLQPASGPLAPDMQFVRKCMGVADRCLSHVHVISQMHKQWGIR